MANIDLGNLTRYDGKIKEYAEDKYLSKNTANWQMTEKAGAVTCYPVPDTELEPIVDFSFKEVPPVSGEKSPSNPSTINGVSSFNIVLCDSVGINETTYNYSLGNTYYGGSVNLATGMMTLTWVGFILTSALSSDGIVDGTDLVQFLLESNTTYKHKGNENTDVACNRFIPSQTFRSTSFESTRYYCRIPKNLLDVSEAVDPDNPTNSEWLQAGNVWFNENPVHFAYKIVTPYIVQLTPIQIKSLFALDKNTPRLNTLYTDADSIQVGYQKHPARTSYELENAILALGGGE